MAAVGVLCRALQKSNTPTRRSPPHPFRPEGGIDGQVKGMLYLAGTQLVATQDPGGKGHTRVFDVRITGGAGGRDQDEVLVFASASAEDTELWCAELNRCFGQKRSRGWASTAAYPSPTPSGSGRPSALGRARASSNLSPQELVAQIGGGYTVKNTLKDKGNPGRKRGVIAAATTPTPSGARRRGSNAGVMYRRNSSEGAQTEDDGLPQWFLRNPTTLVPGGGIHGDLRKMPRQQTAGGMLNSALNNMKTRFVEADYYKQVRRLNTKNKHFLSEVKRFEFHSKPQAKRALSLNLYSSPYSCPHSNEPLLQPQPRFKVIMYKDGGPNGITKGLIYLAGRNLGQWCREHINT